MKRNGELGIFVPAVQSLKEPIAADRRSARTAESRAFEALNLTSRFWLLVKGLAAVGGKCVRVADMFALELMLVHLVIIAALIKNEGTFSSTMCDVRDDFAVEACRVSSGECNGSSSG